MLIVTQVSAPCPIVVSSFVPETVHSYVVFDPEYDEIPKLVSRLRHGCPVKPNLLSYPLTYPCLTPHASVHNAVTYYPPPHTAPGTGAGNLSVFVHLPSFSEFYDVDQSFHLKCAVFIALFDLFGKPYESH